MQRLLTEPGFFDSVLANKTKPLIRERCFEEFPDQDLPLKLERAMVSMAWLRWFPRFIFRIAVLELCTGSAELCGFYR